MKLLLLLISLVTNILADQWIDPHDMNTNAKAKYIKPTPKTSSGASSANKGNGDLSLDVYYSHLKRLVSVLMNSAYVDKRDPDLYHGHIRFSIDPTDFDFLVNFAKNDVSLEKLRKLDTIFSEDFRSSSFDKYLDIMESFQMRLHSLIVNKQNLWLLAVVGLLYILYQLVISNFSLSYICKYFFIIIIIVDFGFRYHHLLEEAEEHNMGIVYSEKCDTNKMSWTEWAKHLFNDKNCERKIVTPLDAFLYQIKHMIINLMHAFGTGMGGFGANLFSNLPWGLNIILWPIMLIFTLILVLFLVTICTGQPIEFNLFHLLKLRFGGESRRENMLTGSTVERLMDRVLHRQMVQNVSLPTSNENAHSVSSGNLTGKEPVSKHEANNKSKLEKRTNSKCDSLKIKRKRTKECKEEKPHIDNREVKESVESVSSNENSSSKSNKENITGGCTSE